MRDATRAQIGTFFLWCCLRAVWTPLFTSTSPICLHCLARCVPRPVWIGPKFSPQLAFPQFIGGQHERHCAMPLRAERQVILQECLLYALVLHLGAAVPSVRHLNTCTALGRGIVSVDGVQIPTVRTGIAWSGQTALTKRNGCVSAGFGVGSWFSDAQDAIQLSLQSVTPVECGLTILPWQGLRGGHDDNDDTYMTYWRSSRTAWKHQQILRCEVLSIADFIFSNIQKLPRWKTAVYVIDSSPLLSWGELHITCLAGDRLVVVLAERWSRLGSVFCHQVVHLPLVVFPWFFRALLSTFPAKAQTDGSTPFECFSCPSSETHNSRNCWWWRLNKQKWPNKTNIKLFPSHTHLLFRYRFLCKITAVELPGFTISFLRLGHPPNEGRGRGN